MFRLSHLQREFLNSAIGPSGYCIETIDEDATLTDGAKVFILQSAISLKWREFYSILDKIYKPSLNDLDGERNLDLIRQFKVINDLCFDTKIKFEDYGSRSALQHYFGKLGSYNAISIQQEVRLHIQHYISELIAKDTTRVKIENIAYMNIHSKETAYSEWRIKLDLPFNQQLATNEILSGGSDNAIQMQEMYNWVDRLTSMGMLEYEYYFTFLTKNEEELHLSCSMLSALAAVDLLDSMNLSIALTKPHMALIEFIEICNEYELNAKQHFNLTTIFFPPQHLQLVMDIFTRLPTFLRGDKSMEILLAKEFAFLQELSHNSFDRINQQQFYVLTDSLQKVYGVPRHTFFQPRRSIPQESSAPRQRHNLDI